MSRFGLGFTSAGVPGNDAFTKILLHMDGSNGGTTFTDVAAGGSSHTWTPTNATTSTSTFKFGPSSMLTSAGYITTPDHADFTIGSSDFAVDYWVNFGGSTGIENLCGQSDAAGNVTSRSVVMSRAATGVILVSLQTPVNTVSLVGATSLNGSSSFVHIALTKSGTTARLFLNGVADGSATVSNPMNDGNGNWSVGRVGLNGTAGSNNIDEFRLSIGAARWTSNFTPPIGPYT